MTTRTTYFAILVILIAGTAVISSEAGATNCTALPNTLTNGTTADASQVMANFTSLRDCANNNLAATSNPSFTGSVYADVFRDTAGDAMLNYAGSNEISVGSGNPSQFLTFYTGGSERLRIDSSGSMGIGTNNPVRGASATYSRILNITGSSGGAQISFGLLDGVGRIESVNGNSASMVLSASSSVSISGSGGTCTFTGAASGGTCFSDKRLKTNIHLISGSDALKGLSEIKGVTFKSANSKLDQSQQIGLIAQDVLKSFPQLVTAGQTELNGKYGTYYQVAYAGLVAPLISAVNELNNRTKNVEAQTQEMDYLRNENAKLRAQMKELASQVQLNARRLQFLDRSGHSTLDHN